MINGTRYSTMLCLIHEWYTPLPNQERHPAPLSAYTRSLAYTLFILIIKTHVPSTFPLHCQQLWGVTRLEASHRRHQLVPCTPAARVHFDHSCLGFCFITRTVQPSHLHVRRLWLANVILLEPRTHLLFPGCVTGWRGG